MQFIRGNDVNIFLLNTHADLVCVGVCYITLCREERENEIDDLYGAVPGAYRVYFLYFQWLL